MLLLPLLLLLPLAVVVAVVFVVVGGGVSESVTVADVRKDANVLTAAYCCHCCCYRHRHHYAFPCPHEVKFDATLRNSIRMAN